MIDRAADRSNMYQIIKDFPFQFDKGIRFAEGVRAKQPVKQAIISGMGGSAFPGDIVRAYLEDALMVPVAVSRDYSLPNRIGPDTLVICSSFSGNTEETISSMYDALDREAQVVVITTGGRLESLCEQFDLPVVRLGKEVPNMQPRASSGYIFAACLSVMANSGLISDRSRELMELGQYLSWLELEQRAMDMAERLADHIPVIYSSAYYGDILARIIKIKFNENSKTQAFYNVFPELNHNEMVGFTHVRARYHFILLRDKADQPRVRRRMDVFGELFQERGLPVMQVNLEGDSFLKRVFGTIYLFDWVSYYLALRYGVDPAPVDMVEDFKKAMGAFAAS